jgi:DNA-directed RNA polymerase specialized sigma24 family protein
LSRPGEIAHNDAPLVKASIALGLLLMNTSFPDNLFPDGVRGRTVKWATTRWSVVRAAGGVDAPVQSHQAREALERLCQIYWYPLYAYARRRGIPSSDAQDITQGFFAELIAKNGLAGVARVTRFRAYLLTAFKHFLSNENVRAHAQKRGGAIPALSLNTENGTAFSYEGRYAAEPEAGATPEKLFERRWALALLEQTLSRVESEYDGAGKRALFDALKPALTGAGESHADTAARLKTTEGAIKIAAHRLRQRYRDILRAEIADTVARPEEIEDELRDLMRALSP